MANVLKLTALVVAYSIANGFLVVAAPQAALMLGAASQDLGILGACSPIGYAGSCLLFGRIFGNLPGKYVVTAGVVLGVFAAVLCASADRVAVVGVAMFLFGISSGAFWPFTSAWMFDFAAPRLPRTKILRLYNVGWTGGTAIGVFAAGYAIKAIGEAGIRQVCVASAIAQVIAVCIALMPPATRNSLAPASSDGTRTPSRIGVALLLAAVIANLTSLAMRTIVSFNYAELNRFQHFEADRMGIFMACGMGGQMLAFVFGSIYEPVLGLRRVYAVCAVSIVLICSAFAFCSDMAVLIPASLLMGLMCAVAFQCNMIAATECFSTPRLGTTFHEAMVGLGGLTPIPAGYLVAAMKSHTDEVTALQSPFFALSAVVLLGLAVQLWLVSRSATHRVLLPASPVPQHVS